MIKHGLLARQKGLNDMHYEIKSAQDYRLYYIYLMELSKRSEPNPILALKIDEKIRNIKYKLRRYVRESDTEYVSGWRVERKVISADYDGYMELVSIPEQFDDEESAREWFERWIYIEPYPSQYDCTGQKFTAWYKIFQRRNRYMAYHCVCLDV